MLCKNLSNVSVNANSPIADFGSHYRPIQILLITALNVDQPVIFLNILSGKDKNIVISKSNFNSVTLDNYLLTDSTKIKLNHWNIPEPTDGIEIDSSKIDIVFVPLLCCDSQGHRVGYGKGFYDNFLGNCNQEVLKIGLSLFDIESSIDDIHEKDIALDICVTPSSIYYFK